MYITLSSCIFLAVLYYTLCMDKDLESFIRDLIPRNAATTAAQAAASSDFSSACARSDTIASPPPQKLEKGAWGGADAELGRRTHDDSWQRLNKRKHSSRNSVSKA